MLLRVALAFAFAALCAQPFEIRGTVTETGANLAITGAEVRLFGFPTVDGFVTRTLIETTYTGSMGEFRFRFDKAGDYFVEASKPGFIGPSLPGGLEMDNAETSVSTVRERPIAIVPMSLSRPSEITGRVTDEDGQPVAGLTLTLISLAPGLPLNVNTNAAGEFTAKRLPPGQYLVRISPGIGPPIATAEFTAEDAAQVDRDFETSYWPGGFDEGSAIPVTVMQGNSVNMGTLRARRISYYRARVLLEGDCTGEERMGLIATLPLPPRARAGPPPYVPIPALPCAKEYLVRNLRAGPYTFALGASNQWAVAAAAVGGENVEVKMALQPAHNIEGRWIAAEGATLPAANALIIDLLPMQDGVTASPRAAPVDGGFAFRNVLFGRQRIRVTIVNGRHYVQEMRFNGRPAIDGVLEGSGQLEIVIDDRPAALTGSMNVRASAWVVLARMPLVSAERFRMERADADGRFRFVGLAPGEYRIFAMPASVENSVLADAEGLGRMASRGEQIGLQRGQTLDVSLAPTDPAR